MKPLPEIVERHYMELDRKVDRFFCTLAAAGLATLLVSLTAGDAAALPDNRVQAQQIRTLTAYSHCPGEVATRRDAAEALEVLKEEWGGTDRAVSVWASEEVDYQWEYLLEAGSEDEFCRIMGEGLW